MNFCVSATVNVWLEDIPVSWSFFPRVDSQKINTKKKSAQECRNAFEPNLRKSLNYFCFRCFIWHSTSTNSNHLLHSYSKDCAFSNSYATALESIPIVSIEYKANLVMPVASFLNIIRNCNLWNVPMFISRCYTFSCQWQSTLSIHRRTVPMPTWKKWKRHRSPTNWRTCANVKLCKILFLTCVKRKR